MEIYNYKDYDEYVREQTLANKKKIDLVYVQKETIDNCISHHIHINLAFKNILCHGTRNGTEQKYFLRYNPDLNVLGTEISDTATMFDNTVQWDFSKENPDWIGKFDIVYSNSFDHSITPKETLQVWLNQLAPNGRLYLEWSDHQNNLGVIASDPLNATSEELKTLITEIGGFVEAIFNSGKHAGIVLVVGKE